MRCVVGNWQIVLQVMRHTALACLCAVFPTGSSAEAETEDGFPPLALVRKLSADGAVVTWETSHELDVVGFYLERSNAGAAESVRITPSLLPAMLVEPGGRYRYVDDTAPPGGGRAYTLVVISRRGREERHGPVTVPRGAPVPAPPATAPAYSRRSHPVSAAQAARIATAAAESAAARLQQEARVGPRLKIAVEETGVYRLDADMVAARTGMSPDEVIGRIAARGWRLSFDGRRVAWIPSDDGSSLYFFNRRRDSLYTEANVFWLEQGNGIVVPPLEGPPPAAPGPEEQWFSDTLSCEEDHYAAFGLFGDPEADYWLWGYVYANREDAGFAFHLPGVLAGTNAASMSVYLQAASDTGLAGEHHAEFTLNDTPVGGVVWQGLTGAVCELEFDQTILSNGPNELRMAGVLGAGIPYSVFNLDSFDVTYHRSYETTDDRILFHGGTNTTVTLRGFSSEPVYVLNITDETRPRLVTATSVSRTNGSVAVTLAPEPGARYAAFAAAGALIPTAVWADVSSSLRSATNRGNYVVITDTRFASRAERLAAYRQSNGWETALVELEDIYDEFSRGNHTPHAIIRFLRHAHGSWETPPTHVLLAGEGTYDYRDLTGTGECVVPILMRMTPHGLFASDNAFGDLAGDDGVPEIAIGRFPAATGAELDMMIDKTLSYEAAPGGAWTQRVVMAADNVDEGGNYPLDSDAAAALLPTGFSVQKIYLSDLDVDDARELMTNSINRGTALLHYIGHSGWDCFADERLLVNGDMASLTNANRLAVAVAITCFVNRFEVSGHDFLGEQLMLRPGGGAVCVWAPTGLSINSLGRTLDQAFLRARYQSGQRVIGSAVKSALLAYGATGRSRFMLDIYVLLGDPATVMK